MSLTDIDIVGEAGRVAAADAAAARAATAAQGVWLSVAESGEAGMATGRGRRCLAFVIKRRLLEQGLPGMRRREEEEEENKDQFD